MLQEGTAETAARLTEGAAASLPLRLAGLAADAPPRRATGELFKVVQTNRDITATSRSLTTEDDARCTDDWPPSKWGGEAKGLLLWFSFPTASASTHEHAAPGGAPHRRPLRPLYEDIAALQWVGVARPGRNQRPLTRWSRRTTASESRRSSSSRPSAAGGTPSCPRSSRARARPPASTCWTL